MTTLDCTSSAHDSFWVSTYWNWSWLMHTLVLLYAWRYELYEPYDTIDRCILTGVYGVVLYHSLYRSQQVSNPNGMVTVTVIWMPMSRQWHTALAHYCPDVLHLSLCLYLYVCTFLRIVSPLSLYMSSTLLCTLALGFGLLYRLWWHASDSMIHMYCNYKVLESEP
jgi:hypothetical protein